MERDAARDAGCRAEAAIADCERLIACQSKEIIQLKAQLYDYIIACGELLPD